MSRVNTLEQGSQEWLKWRESGIGASDVAVVLGISSFKTRFQLWAEKTKLVKPAPFHPRAVSAMERGKLLEPEIRDWYERKTGTKAEPKTLVHPEHPCMRASLDGDTGVKIVEIKAPGKTDHGAAKKGKVPAKYLAQMQMQMLIAGRDEGDYVSHDGSRDLATGQLSDAGGVIINVKADPKRQAEIEEAVLWFWDLVTSKRPPDVDQKDMDDLVQRLAQQQEEIKDTVALMQIVNESLLQGASGF